MKPSGGGGGDWLGLGEDNGDSKSLELSNASLKSSSSFSNDIKKDTPETQGMVSEFSYASLIRKVCPGTKCVPVKGITTKEIFPTADQLFGPVIFFRYFRLPPVTSSRWKSDFFFLQYKDLLSTSILYYLGVLWIPNFITSFSMNYLQTLTYLK